MYVLDFSVDYRTLMLRLLLLNITTLLFQKFFMAIDAWETSYRNIRFLSPWKQSVGKMLLGPLCCQTLERTAGWSPTMVLEGRRNPPSLAALKSLNLSWTFGFLHHILHPSRTQAGSLATLLPSCPPTQNSSPFFLCRLLGSLPDGLFLQVSEKPPLPSFACLPHVTFTHSSHYL